MPWPSLQMPPDVHQLSRGLRSPALLLHFPPQEAAQEARKLRRCSSADQGICECLPCATITSPALFRLCRKQRPLPGSSIMGPELLLSSLHFSSSVNDTLLPCSYTKTMRRSGGVNFRNIRPLQRSQLPQPLNYLAAKVALLNCRSVSSKTTLYDFFTQRDLDMLFLTQTWIGSGAGESCFWQTLPHKLFIHKHSEEFGKRRRSGFDL